MVRRTLRWTGLLLLGVLLWRIELPEAIQALKQASGLLVVVAILLNGPQLLVKSSRWWMLLRGQGLLYALRDAVLAYFGSVYIGLLTPGRLGEAVKAQHVRRDLKVSAGVALSSVLVDRLYDLMVLVAVGLGALAAAGPQGGNARTIYVVAAFLAAGVVVFVAFLHNASYQSLVRFARRAGERVSPLLRGAENLRAGLQVLSPRTLAGGLGLTTVAYGIFYTQCYLLAQALALPLDALHVAYAVTVGSLVTLLPLSISGLGTREAAIVAYLQAVGVAAAPAFAFAVLVFVTFYVTAALMGAVAWVLKPMPA